MTLYGAVDTTKDTKITKEDIAGEADTETASTAEVCTQLVLIAQAKSHLVCARILRFLSYLRVLRDLRGDPTAVSRLTAGSPSICGAFWPMEGEPVVSRKGVLQEPLKIGRSACRSTCTSARGACFLANCGRTRTRARTRESLLTHASRRQEPVDDYGDDYGLPAATVAAQAGGRARNSPRYP
jgi:hypothetical protein